MSACKARLVLKGEHFECELDAPHPGLAHVNDKAEAVWISNGEAQASEKKTRAQERAEAIKAQIEGERVDDE